MGEGLAKQINGLSLNLFKTFPPPDHQHAAHGYQP